MEGQLTVNQSETLLKDKHRLSIPGKRICLVGIAAQHAPLIMAWRNDPAIRSQYFYRGQFTAASQAAWQASYDRDPDDISFIITLKSGRAIGMVAIYNIEWSAHRAEFGRLLIGDPAARRQGYAREASELAINFAASLGIAELHLCVRAANFSALKLYRAAGFIETATAHRTASDGAEELATSMVRRP
ncbi:MAG: GNAT family N-acetyltransferase [Proteobacteria bacterium]|nr:GNAT family N-acetyltransferase [Pseudomonadota bacterium]